MTYSFNGYILLSGSVLVKNKFVRTFLEEMIRDKYPNMSIKVNKDKPVMSTVREKLMK